VNDTPTRCAKCYTEIDPKTALWGDNGMICDACDARGQLDARYLKTIKGAGYGALAAAIVSVVFDPLLMVTFMAVGSIVWTFRSYALSPL
jgi:hypothetical protein